MGQRDLMATLLPEIAVALPEQGQLDPHSLFNAPVGKVWLEIGFGGGEHLVALASAHPEHGFIGCEVFENGVAKLVAEVDRRGLGNVRILVDDARLLLATLTDASLAGAFILFPDPWPKERHKKRRMVSRETLDELARVMRPGAELRLATDVVDYQRWMLERATDHPGFRWLVRGPADWRERPGDWPQTRYERKAIAAGRRPMFLRLARNNG